MFNNRLITIALVAGEISGDILGAGLIRALKAQIPNIRCVGIAGPLMRAEGCEAWYEIDELSVIGIIEIISKIRRLLKIRTDLINRFNALQPNIFIGIDAPDFNLALESYLRKKGIITVHYISPSVWAWRQKRLYKIKKSTNLVLISFPFETKIYKKFNIPYRFVGHTIADQMPLDPDKNAMRDMLGISRNDRCLALLPGSRKYEIKRLSNIFLKTVEILRLYYPDLKVIVPIVNSKCYKQFKHIKENNFPDLKIRLINNQSREVMIASDAALLSSGTATLECMLAKCPMVVGYFINPLTFWIAKKMIKINYISIPNLLANYKLVAEFLQKDCQPEKLAKSLLPLLKNKTIDSKIYAVFRSLHQQVRYNADEKAANAILELIKNKFNTSL